MKKIKLKKKRIYTIFVILSAVFTGAVISQYGETILIIVMLIHFFLIAPITLGTYCPCCKQHLFFGTNSGQGEFWKFLLGNNLIECPHCKRKIKVE